MSQFFPKHAIHWVAMFCSLESGKMQNLQKIGRTSIEVFCAIDSADLLEEIKKMHSIWHLSDRRKLKEIKQQEDKAIMLQTKVNKREMQNVHKAFD